jgi:hypothetical protein
VKKNGALQFGVKNPALTTLPPPDLLDLIKNEDLEISTFFGLVQPTIPSTPRSMSTDDSGPSNIKPTELFQPESTIDNESSLHIGIKSSIVFSDNKGPLKGKIDISTDKLTSKFVYNHDEIKSSYIPNYFHTSNTYQTLKTALLKLSQTEIENLYHYFNDKTFTGCLDNNLYSTIIVNLKTQYPVSMEALTQTKFEQSPSVTAEDDLMHHLDHFKQSYKNKELQSKQVEHLLNLIVTIYLLSEYHSSEADWA